MKHTYCLALLLLISLFAFAQDATLTKQETIDYINKKQKEAEGHKKIIGNKTYTFKTLNFKKNDKGIEIYLLNEDYVSETITFNPAHIKEMKEGQLEPSSVVGVIKITLIGKTGLQTFNNNKTSIDTVWVQYLKADPANYKRLEKALLHLKALYKAEEDPFDN